jgi:phosphoenolpyruvate carboxykinase (ATP)
MREMTTIKWSKITTISSLITMALAVLFFNELSYNHHLTNTKTISPNTQIHYNLNYSEIFKNEMEDGEIVASNNVVAINTGKFTGRSPKDKYIVKQDPSQDHIWWGNINKPMTPQVYSKLYNLVLNHYQTAKKIYIFDGYSGANPNSRIKVRFITEIAWQHHFVKNMFISSKTTSIKDFKPDFTIINACKVTNPNWKKDGLNSEIFIAFNLEEKTAIIGGTWYGGEMKKGIFSIMNYILPLKGIMTMHCSANIDQHGNTALFFGLSGTGKTTLSADPNRYLIGDDEHGWDTKGIFNLEGGCYAKTIHLSPETEPEIFKAIKRDALLENVYVDTSNNKNEVDYFDTRNTENSRVSYPLYHISNYKQDGQGNHPKHIIFLTADAFGVLPPIARLSTGQAMYHFLSGYTAKVAGTERGITEPEATFSACFGDPFLPLHPTKYADLFLEKLTTHKTQVYLVNTGWTGGPYGIGERMSIQTTRSCIDAILNDKISQNQSNFRKDEVFGIDIPIHIDGIDPHILDPRKAWNDTKTYDKTRIKLASMFVKNYKQYITQGNTDFSMYGPVIP